MRHNRSAAFTEAWSQTNHARWSDHTSDPNDPPAIAHRGRTLEAAWMPTIANRIRFLTDRCRGRNVLDIGCVAHDRSRFDDDAWLHRHLADVAARCVGVDILEDGIAAMRDAGFDVVAHDLTTGLGPLTDRAPFDVIVAGELIEHLGDLDLLFRVARAALADHGELILTTPNPYAPARVRAGQRGLVWENADHVAYLFPAGIAELADRNGLVLTGATTIDDRPAGVGPVRRLKQLIRGSGWRRTGYDTLDGGKQAGIRGAVADRLSRRARFTGETFVYVVTRPGGPA